MVLGHDLSTGHRTQDVRISEDVSLDTMLLREATLKGLKKAGFLRPSPVQLYGIPLGKCGFDLLLEAKSGTGKTAVFTVISLEKLDLDKGVQTIILAPTREIASQISYVITEIGSQYTGLNVAVVMGGLPVKDDVEKFKENVHVVVGSPGRLRHLIQDKHIDISTVRLFVLDEADKLMESSFLPDINYIFSLLPKQKQVIMSSATYSEETKTFISKYVKKAQHVCPDSNSVLLGIAQKVVIVPHNSNIVKQTKNRYEVLKKILNSKQFKQCLIFCNYQVRVGELYRMLSRDKWPAEQLYGQQEQMNRLDALKTLQEYKCRILVSTDLAARGIDASNVDVVINFEPPYEWQTYLHRIGRAGRYGSYGTAISILSEGAEIEKFKKMLVLTNIQFNLRTLWNDEPFDLSLENNTLEDDKIPVTIVPNNVTFQNGDMSEDVLWKALTKGPLEKHNIKPEVTSFTELCDSFKTSSEPNIETFSDLVQSCKMNQNEIRSSKGTIEFKQVNVAKLPVDDKKYWDNFDKEYANQVNSLPNSEKPITTTLPNITNGDVMNNRAKFNKNERYLTEVMEKESTEKYLLEASPKMSNNMKTKPDNACQVILGKDLERKSDVVEIDPIKQNSTNLELKTTFGKDKHGKKHSNIQESDPNKKNTSDSIETKIDPIQLAIANTNIPTASSSKQKQGESHSINDDCKSTDETENYHIELSLIDTGTNNLENFKQNNRSKIHRYNDSAHHEKTTGTTDIEAKQALIDAGLPTAFGKNKQNKNHYNDNQKTKIEKSNAKQIQQRYKKIQEIDTKKAKNISSSKTFTRENYIQKCVSNTVESDSSDSSHESSINAKNTSKFRNNYEAYASTYNKTSCHCQSKKRINSMEQNRAKQFDTWYKQLQQQTQSIQYVLYIEELKKL